MSIVVSAACKRLATLLWSFYTKRPNLKYQAIYLSTEHSASGKLHRFNCSVCCKFINGYTRHVIIQLNRSCSLSTAMIDRWLQCIVSSLKSHLPSRPPGPWTQLAVVIKHDIAFTSGQSYKASTSVNYNSTIVITSKLLIFMTLDS